MNNSREKGPPDPISAFPRGDRGNRIPRPVLGIVVDHVAEGPEHGHHAEGPSFRSSRTQFSRRAMSIRLSFLRRRSFRRTADRLGREGPPAHFRKRRHRGSPSETTTVSQLQQLTLAHHGVAGFKRPKLDLSRGASSTVRSGTSRTAAGCSRTPECSSSGDALDDVERQWAKSDIGRCTHLSPVR
jgi:hypothetical protein